MKRHNLDPKVLDYTWKQNRLSKDKELLKSSMLDVIRKKPKVAADKTNANNSIMPRESGNPGINSGMNTGMGGAQPYNGGGQAGGTMMAMQQAPAAYQQPALQNAQAQGRATYTKQ
jgi:hypothetical protein